jgi:hypothetical protein
MEVIIVQLILTILNIGMAFLNYDKKNYKTAMFSMFSAGVCFVVFLNAI